jgi:glutathione synthase/RimK-type ligase-like ATP-grasp enzyme
MKYSFLALGAHKELGVFREKFRKTDVDFVSANLSDIEMFIANNQLEVMIAGRDVSSFDYVWLTASWGTRATAHAVALFLEDQDVEFSRVEREGSKLVDTLMLHFKGIELPSTYFTSVKNFVDKFETIVEHCKLPFIMKSTRGSLGDEVYLVDSQESFESIVSKLDRKQKFIFQEFIPNTFDYRIIVSEGNIVSAVKRIRKADSFRNNTYLGAVEVFMDINELPSEVVHLSINSASSLDLDWAGVDIVTATDSGKSYVLEVNRRPGLTAGSIEVTAAYNHILNITS